VKAKARANIWSYTYRMLKPYFETMTNRPLSRGMKILVNTQVVFHELYGYSLNIIDIEPGYTLGDIELKRRETINRLIADGVMEMNKEQELDILPKRVPSYLRQLLPVYRISSISYPTIRIVTYLSTRFFHQQCRAKKPKNL
jgi:hypothetical protein